MRLADVHRGFPVHRLLAAALMAGLLLHELLHAGGGGAPLAHFGPAMLLLAPLLLGRYPGERLLARLVRSGRRPRPRRAPAPPGRAPRRRAPRRPAVMAAHLATRPPPGAFACAS